MKKCLIIGMICFFGLGLSGCKLTTKSNEEKLEQAIVEKTGTIQIKSEDGYLLNTKNGIVTITSNKVNLDNYMKKEITVKGMFSGSTLYVDEVKN